MSRKGSPDDQARRAAQMASDRRPILVLPKQTIETIAERGRIREELHDARAVTVKGGLRGLRKRR